MNYPTLMRQAMAHYQAGRFAEAEPILRKAHLADRTRGDPLHNLGLIAAASGRMDEAIDLMRRSIEREPANAVYRRNLAVELTKSGRPGEAELAVAAAQEGLRLAPGDPMMVVAFAQAAGAAARPREAADAWRWVAAHAMPDEPAVHFNFGANAELAGDTNAAIAGYEAALRLRPDHLDALNNLAALSAKLGRHAQAIAVLRGVHERRPDSSEILALLGSLLAETGAVSEGEALLERAVAMQAGDRPHLRALGRALSSTGRVREAVDAFARHARLDPSDASAYSSMLMTAQYLWPDDPPAQLELHRRFDRDYCAAIPPLPPVRPVALDRRLRIGYVSVDLRAHPVGYFFEPLLAAHDRQRVEIHCFSSTGVADATTGRLRAAAEHWHDVAALNDDQLARLVRDAQVDVLIDLGGHTADSRLRMFARRPAPLQLTYLGYPNTTGMASIDGRITDAVADPPGATEAFHAERLLRMPHVFALFHPPADAPAVAALPAPSAGHVTLAGVAALVKVNEAVYDAWADVLRRLPAAHFLLVGRSYADAVVQGRVLDQFRQRGVDPARVEFLAQLSLPDFFALHARIDLILDTFPFNGHTTTVQNLWMGVPVLTLAGVSHRSRMGASVLTSLGLQEFIATDPADYAARAVRLAGDLERLAEIRAGLRERMLASPLMNAPRFARDFDDLVLGAWDERLARG